PRRELNPSQVGNDYAWTFASNPAGFTLAQWDIGNGNFTPVNLTPGPDGKKNTLTWKMPWSDTYETHDDSGAKGGNHTLQEFLRYAYIPEEVYTGGDDPDFGNITPASDPPSHWMPTGGVVEDARVGNPTQAAFDAAVRGAAEQFAAPYFKFDPNSEYDRTLQ